MLFIIVNPLLLCYILDNAFGGGDTLINIAICDDDKRQLSEIVSIIKNFENLHINQQQISLKLFGNGADLISDIEKGSRYHIILLDIIMPLENGIDVAREIRCFDNIAKIIFVTSSPEFAVESYDVGAFHYLTKPIAKDKLLAIIRKAVSDIFDIPKETILIHAKTGLSKIYLHNIEFVEIFGKQLTYHLRDGHTLEVKGTFGEHEKILLSHKQFIKPHRSYLINMDFIDTITTKEIRTQNHLSIPLSRIKYPDIIKIYLEYSFKRGEN